MNSVTAELAIVRPGSLLRDDWQSILGLDRDRRGPEAPIVNAVDLQDIDATLGGNGDAYARIVERYQDRIAARMWRFTRDRAEHRELVHEVFVEAYVDLARYRGDAPFEHWLARIATHVGYRFWKRRSASQSGKSVPIDELHDLAAVESQAFEPAQAAQVLHKLLDRLPPRDRLVLMLRYVEERSLEETAALTGWSQTMVKVQCWRARKKLKRLLEQAGMEVEP